MFLKKQFFFYKIYFKIMDPTKCLVLSWSPRLEYFKMSRSSSAKAISYFLIGMQVLYLCAAWHVFVGLKMRGAMSTISLALHLPMLSVQWHALLFRSLYTTKAKELVCLMNTLIFLEKHHCSNKFAY